MSSGYVLPPPSSFDIHDRNAAELWKEWRERWQCYAMATELCKKDKEVQVSVLLTVIGPEAHKVFHTFQLTAEERKDVKKVLEAFQNYCQPFQNTAFERYRFNLRGQRPGESFEQYVTSLRQIALRCNFETITPDEILRDRIMFGITDNKVRDRLLREKNLTLERTLEICRANEVSSAQQKEVSKIQDSSIHVIGKGKKQPKTDDKKTFDFRRAAKQPGWISDCRFCGRDHKKIKEECPAWGKECAKCKKRNHFKVKCSNVQSFQPRRVMRGVHSVQESDEMDSDLQIYTVRTVSSIKLHDEQTVTLKISPKVGIRFQIDCGADCNVLPVHVYKAATCDFKLRNVVPSETILYAYGQTGNRSAGRVRIQVWRGDLTTHLECELISGERFHSILGRQACIELEILEIKDNDKVNPVQCIQGQKIFATQKEHIPISKEGILKRYPKVFNDVVGRLSEGYKIRVDKSVVPVQHAPRRVPAALRARLQKELNQMEEDGIIKQVSEPTDWVSSIVVVPKQNEKIRICLDPRDLNKAIRRENYQLPTIEDIASRLAGARVFTILDVKKGFWHVPLDEESSYLTTFNTPYGRYRWLRMPFGISSAPEVFQKRMHQLIEGLEGIEVVADDFMVYGCGQTQEEAIEDHDRKLQTFLQRCEDRHVVLGAEKFQLRQREVPFIGHVATADGLKASPQRVKAIVDMPAPSDVTGVRRFLGMVQYLSKFLPGLADMTKVLRDLTQKNVDFVWQEAQEKAFKNLKSVISSVPVLRYYDLKDEVTLQCDASQYGLGAVLLQDGQPVAFASRALTPTEQRYAQIEKECLSIVFGCEKFNQYIYGRDFVSVQTDHQPLESIFKKPLEATPARLQRMLLKLQKYCLKVHYVRGKHMYIADTLSRATVNEESSAFISSLEKVNIKDSVMVSDERLYEIQCHSKEDETLQALSKVIALGWPDTRQEVPDLVRPYFNYRDELHAEDGMLFKGNRIIVPKSLRKKMLDVTHQGHIGLEGCLRRMREALFWPGMASDLKALVQQCDACLSVRDSPPKEPLLSHNFAPRPWSKVGADLFYFDNRTFLVMVDYYSNYIEICKLQSQTTICVIKEMQGVFARYGVPDQLMTDNGPQFSNAEFSSFAKKWAFQHITSSPHYPRSNGKAENAVRTVKKLFSKCKLSGESEFMALLNWRNTPTEGMDTSPSQRLMGRRCKTVMPCISTLLEPRYITEKDTKNIKTKKAKQAYYYNRNTRKRAPIVPGEMVRMRLPNQKEWSSGRCIEEVAPRSYDIQVGDTTYRRNRNQLFATKEQFLNKECTEDTDERAVAESSPVENQQKEEIPLVPNCPVPEVPILRRSTRIRRPPKRYGQDI